MSNDRHAVKQELLLELHCRCTVCGNKWVVEGPRYFQQDTSCCWSTIVREVPTQYLFSDEVGAWVRRAA